MSKYVKELMMDQLRSDLDGTTSVLLLDFKGLDAITENQLRLDLRKKKIRIRALKNSLARKVFSEMGLEGMDRYLEGPSVAAWGGGGVAELAKEITAQLKKLKKPKIKGGAVDGVVIGPEKVEVITKLPSREELIGRVVQLALSPVQRVVALANAPASGLLGQLKTLAEGGEAAPAVEDAETPPSTADGEPPPGADEGA